jgi:hypothetical protein
MRSMCCSTGRSSGIFLTALSFLAVSWLFPPLLGTALAQESAAQAMAHAIARMMETMGFSATGTHGSAPPPIMGQPMGMGDWPAAVSQLPQAMPSPAQAGAMADAMERSLSGASGAMPWGGASRLEGLWEDNQGGLLIVQGGLYRLYSGCRGYIEGEIRVGGDRIELSNRRENFTQSFEFALDQGRLALRDQNGQLYLYRRLILEQSQPQAR